MTVVTKVRKHIVLGFGIVILVFFIYFLMKSFLATLFYLKHFIDTKSTTYKYIFPLIRSLSAILNRTKWFIMYHFVLQVNIIVIKIDSDSPEILRERENRAIKIKDFLYSVYLSMAIIIVGNSILEQTQMVAEDEKYGYGILSIVETINKFIILLIDVYMTYLFVNILKFY